MNSILRRAKAKAANLARASLLRARVRDRNFTIITNNCWGRHIYHRLGEPYRTPFIGLYLSPDCFINLIRRTRWYLEQDVVFIAKSQHESVISFRDEQDHPFPIGLIGGDVELQFLHYESEQEAFEKWNRRRTRIVANEAKWFYKFCDREASAKHIEVFDAAELQNKVCFVARPYEGLKSTVYIPESKGGQVPDGKQLSNLSPQYFDAASWLNGGDGRPRGSRLLRYV